MKIFYNRFKFSTGLFLTSLLILFLSTKFSNAQIYSGNPILPYYMADPDILMDEATGKYYIYPSSGWWNNFNAYSSTDLTNWVDEGAVFQMANCSWANDRPWAPTVVHRNNKYYFYYSASIKIGVAVGNSPVGPFVDKGSPLVGSDPFTTDIIDPDVFVDDNGKAYMYYGGSNGARMVVRELNADMISFKSAPYDITPPYYTEAPKMVKRNGIYYMTYSNGAWNNGTYNVRYSTSSSPTGPWTYGGQILSSGTAYSGPGHHTIMKMPNCDEYYIVYHRYEGNDYSQPRKTTIDRLYFNTNGTIKPVQMTKSGVRSRAINGDCRAPEPPNPITVAGGTYRLTHKGTSQRLSATGATAGSNVVQDTDNGGQAQHWIITDEGSGYYKLRLEGTNQCLDVGNNSPTNGANVSIFNDNGNDAQRWRIEPDGGFYKLTHKGTNQCLDVAGASATPFTNIQQWADSGNDAQRWQIDLVEPSGTFSNGLYELEPQCAPGKRLEVVNGASTNGANVQIYQQNGTARQAWKILGVGNGYYELIPQSANGRRLDVAGSGSANGTNLDIWDASNNNAQKWKIMDQGNGYYELAPACAPGQRMDVAGFGNTNNTNTHIWQDGSNTAQRWKLIPKTINSNFASKANPLENTLKDFTDEKDATGFSIYPNPASSSIKIDLPNGEAIAELQISDLQGKVLLTKLLKKSQSVDIRHLSAGVYIVRLQRDDALHTRKLVVE